MLRQGIMLSMPSGPWKASLRAGMLRPFGLQLVCNAAGFDSRGETKKSEHSDTAVICPRKRCSDDPAVLQS